MELPPYFSIASNHKDIQNWKTSLEILSLEVKFPEIS